MTPPAVVHVGCGDLGIGAVLPLLHSAFPDSSFFLIQRAQSDKWRDLKSGSNCVLANETGFFRNYLARRVRSPDDLTGLPTASADPRESLLLLLEDFGLLSTALKHIGDKRTIVSSAIGDGQRELALALRAVPDNWAELLSFDNTVRVEEPLGSVLRPKVRQIVADRICWGSGYRAGDPSTMRFAKCEREVASFWIPSGGSISPAIVHGNLKDSGFEGVRLEVREYTTTDELNQARFRKRALVNASHAVLAILCFEVLQKREMGASEQYLATAEALFAKAWPEGTRCLDLYIRLRAAEVAWQECTELTSATGDNSSAEALHPSDAWQAAWSECYRIARRAVDRFLGTSDRLDRVFSATRLTTDLGRREEHITKPLTWFDQDRQKVLPLWRLGRPSETEIAHLRPLLEAAFDSAMRMSQGRAAK